MACKPNKNLDVLRSQAQLGNGEEYIGAFMSRSKIKWGWYFVIGPLAALAMKQYQVMVTNQGIFFGRLSMLGKLSGVDKFNYGEITSVSIKKGMLVYKINFRFKNGRSLVLDSNHKAMISMEGFLFDQNMEEYLTKAIA